MLKAVREAKQRSSWLDADDGYEQALQQAVDLLLARLEPNPFLTDLRRVVAEIAPYGCVNSLALMVLKLTCPGVPDIYQGSEDWNYSLVDPDNRRPVDYAALRAWLEAALAPAAVVGMPPCGGLHKLFVTATLLHWRRDGAEALLRDGDYKPLAVRGEHAGHLLAYLRCHAQQHAIAVVPRLTWQVSGCSADALLDGGCWGDTEVVLPDGVPSAWRSVLTGQPVPSLRAADLLRGLPVAVLQPGFQPAKRGNSRCALPLRIARFWPASKPV